MLWVPERTATINLEAAVSEPGLRAVTLGGQSNGRDRGTEGSVGCGTKPHGIPRRLAVP